MPAIEGYIGNYHPENFTVDREVMCPSVADFI
jgi:hypothetical protein